MKLLFALAVTLVVAACGNQTNDSNKMSQTSTPVDPKKETIKSGDNAQEMIRNNFLLREYEHALSGNKAAGFVVASACATKPYSFKFKDKFYGKCFEIAKMVAESGDAAAEYLLSKYYEAGIGVIKNDSSSSDYVIKAAKKGFPEAQNQACKYYAIGTGVEENIKTAEMYCNMAVSSGFSKNASNLAVVKAKRNRNDNAQFQAEIASLQLRGSDLLRDPYSGIVFEKLAGFGITPLTEEAFMRIKNGAIAGIPLAQHMAANMLFNSDGISGDLARGYAWALLAKQSEEYKTSFDIVSNIASGPHKLTTKSKNLGQRLASQWVVGSDFPAD